MSGLDTKPSTDETLCEKAAILLLVPGFLSFRTACCCSVFWRSNSPLLTQPSSSTPPAGGQLHHSPWLLVFQGEKGKEERRVIEGVR